MSKLSDRLKQLAYEKRVSIRELERIMHVANGYVSGIGETMGADKVENILQRFPDVSRDWLLFGDGGMLRSITNIQIGDGKRNDDVIVKMLETLTEQGKRHLDIIDNAIALAKELEEIRGLLRQVLDKIDTIGR